MSDYRNTKSTITHNYPVLASAASGLLDRVEAPLTPKVFRSRFLKGTEQIFAKLGIKFSDDEIKDRIVMAMNEVELLTNTPMDPVQFTEKLPMDRSLYRSFVFLRTAQGQPVQENFQVWIAPRTFQAGLTLDLDWTR